MVLSAFDSDENLRRAIPLQVYEFIGKPLPERDGFEARIPDGLSAPGSDAMIIRSRNRRAQSPADLDSAPLEREVELVASESARDALLQTASLLTTIHAHLVGATSILAARAKRMGPSPTCCAALRRPAKPPTRRSTSPRASSTPATAIATLSPALVNSGVRHAVNIACRMTRAEDANKT